MNAVNRIPRYAFRKDWVGETVVIMGNGTSMLDVNTDLIRGAGVRSMVTNGGYVLFPEADVLMCSDRHWLAEQDGYGGYKGPLIVTTQPQAVKVHDPRFVAVKRYFVEHPRAAHIMQHDPGTLVEGHTSVSTCISAAAHRGVRRIILLGVDLRPGPERKRRATDSLTDDPANARRRYARQALHFGKQAETIRRMGIEVVNCSPPSILSAYPMGELSEILKC